MRYFVLFFATFIFTSVSSQNTIRWMDWDEVMEAQEQEKRKIFVDVYTDWCKVCKKMDNQTLNKDEIAKFINTNYYPVKFNAETRDPIEFRGKTYNYISTTFGNGYHELAMLITQGKLKYPTYVFLDEHMNILQPIPGFQDCNTFELIISYFAHDFYKTTPWRSYVNQNRKDFLSTPVKNGN